MRPISDINVGDIYQMPYPFGSISWVVINVNREEKMVEIESSYKHPSLPSSIWKRNTDRIFQHRVLEGKVILESLQRNKW